MALTENEAGVTLPSFQQILPAQHAHYTQPAQVSSARPAGDRFTGGSHAEGTEEETHAGSAKLRNC